MTQLHATKTRFMEALSDIQFPITFEDWKNIPSLFKTAAIFVNFYDAITVAWYKASAEFVPEEDGVSIVLQYLDKNVQQGKITDKTFTPNYIYRVAYNSMGCLRRVQGAIDAFNLNISQYANDGDEEFDLFDRITSDYDLADDVYGKLAIPAFWKLVESLDKDSLTVLEYFIGSRNTLGKKVAAKYDDILADLQKKFKKFRPIFCEEHHSDVIRFAQIWKSDDNIKSAVVEMSNGVQAIYYGETREMHNGSIRVVFFGPDQDYIVPLERAKTLKVVDVEMY